MAAPPGLARGGRRGSRLRLHLIGAGARLGAARRQPADLYRGARLSAALDWAAEHQVELNATEREFLEASRLATQREVEKERRTNRRLRLLLVGAAGLLVVAVAAGGFALLQAGAAREQQGLAERREGEAETAGKQAETARQQAETAARFARSRELAASSTAELDKDPALAKLLAVAAADAAPPDIDIESALHQAWSADLTVHRWAWPDDVPFENLITDLHPDGNLMVASGDQGKNNHTLMVVDLPGDRVVWSFRPDCRRPRSSSVASRPTAPRSWPASSGRPGMTRLWRRRLTPWVSSSGMPPRVDW